MFMTVRSDIYTMVIVSILFLGSVIHYYWKKGNACKEDRRRPRDPDPGNVGVKIAWVLFGVAIVLFFIAMAINSQ